MKRAVDIYWKRIAAGLGVILPGVLMRDYLLWLPVLGGLGLIVWGLATWPKPARKAKK